MKRVLTLRNAPDLKKFHRRIQLLKFPKMLSGAGPGLPFQRHLEARERLDDFDRWIAHHFVSVEQANPYVSQPAGNDAQHWEENVDTMRKVPNQLQCSRREVHQLVARVARAVGMVRG